VSLCKIAVLTAFAVVPALTAVAQVATPDTKPSSAEATGKQAKPSVVDGSASVTSRSFSGGASTTNAPGAGGSTSTAGPDGNGSIATPHSP
jgi:hypothetical protein